MTKRSKLWFFPRNQIKEILDTSSSILEALKNLKLSISGTNYRIIKEICGEEHWDYFYLKEKFTNSIVPKYSLEEILVENSPYNTGALKKRLLNEGILKNICSICGIFPIWNGKELKFQLDHINGSPRDHRIENLRIICPNCHSQTDTFAGKNVNHGIKSNKYLSKEEKLLLKEEKYKKYLAGEKKHTNPSKEELAKLVWEMPTAQIAKKFAVDTSTVSRWIKSFNIENPPPFFWRRKLWDISKKQK